MRNYQAMYYAGASISMLVGLWHFTVPWLFGWASYIPYATLVVSINYVNLCFSFLLFGLRLILLLWGKKYLQRIKKQQLCSDHKDRRSTVRHCKRNCDLESCSDYTGILHDQVSGNIHAGIFSIYASSKKMGREGYIMKKRIRQYIGLINCFEKQK